MVSGVREETAAVWAKVGDFSPDCRSDLAACSPAWPPLLRSCEMAINGPFSLKLQASKLTCLPCHRCAQSCSRIPAVRPVHTCATHRTHRTDNATNSRRARPNGPSLRCRVRGPKTSAPTACPSAGNRNRCTHRRTRHDNRTIWPVRGCSFAAVADVRASPEKKEKLVTLAIDYFIVTYRIPVAVQRRQIAIVKLHVAGGGAVIPTAHLLLRLARLRAVVRRLLLQRFLVVTFKIRYI
jgi:hypothetical protein